MKLRTSFKTLRACSRRATGIARCERLRPLLGLLLARTASRIVIEVTAVETRREGAPPRGGAEESR